MTIASQIEGRIRFRSPDLRDGGLISQVKERIERMEGVLRVQDNPRTGSLLVEYDPGRTDMDALERAVESPAQGPDRQPPKPALWCFPAPRTRMRIAKGGMLLALTSSLSLLLLGREKAHGVAGGIFALFASYHIYGYRKRVLQ